MKDYILTSLIAIITSVFCVHLLRPLAVRIGFVDRPSERKHHGNEIPLIGGVVLFFGFCFSLLGLHVSLMPYRSLLAGSALLVLIGVVDDFHDLSARLRLFGQLMVALMLTAWGGLLIRDLGTIFYVGDLSLGLWALPFTVLLVVAYINAFNMIDGQDGLAGCIGLAQVFWLFLFSLQLNLSAISHILMILMMLLLVFLNFNMRLPWRARASIFMGDCGSTLLAFILAWITIMLSQAQMSMVRPVALLWVVALPLFDLLTVVLHRLYQRKAVATPGHDHIHHVLQRLGVRKSYSTLILGGFQLGLGAIGYFLNRANVADVISFVTFLSLLVLYFVTVTWFKAAKAPSSELMSQEHYAK